MEDGQKFIWHVTEPELTTDDGQKIITDITKAVLTTVDRHKIIEGAKSLVVAQKKWRAKKG